MVAANSPALCLTVVTPGEAVHALPSYGPSTRTAWLSYKHRNVAGDKWESEKGCDCSSEPKPDLMVSRVVLEQAHQALRPNTSCSTSGL